MQQVYLLSEVESTVGCFGYSVVRQPLVTGRAPERLTLWFIRDNDGFTHHALILEAK